MATCFFVSFAEAASPTKDIASGVTSYFHQHSVFQAVGMISAAMSLISAPTSSAEPLY